MTINSTNISYNEEESLQAAIRASLEEGSPSTSPEKTGTLVIPASSVEPTKSSGIDEEAELKAAIKMSELLSTYSSSSSSSSSSSPAKKDVIDISSDSEEDLVPVAAVDTPKTEVVVRRAAKRGAESNEEDLTAKKQKVEEKSDKQEKNEKADKQEKVEAVAVKTEAVASTLAKGVAVLTNTVRQEKSVKVLQPTTGEAWVNHSLGIFERSLMSVFKGRIFDAILLRKGKPPTKEIQVMIDNVSPFWITTLGQLEKETLNVITASDEDISIKEEDHRELKHYLTMFHEKGYQATKVEIEKELGRLFEKKATAEKEKECIRKGMLAFPRISDGNHEAMIAQYLKK
ncbi:MAG: hypothetical protein JWO53_1267 [Chlamydiia bacterium]|nr:hypothetical protein [Chlamydiia bacterium]